MKMAMKAADTITTNTNCQKTRLASRKRGRVLSRAATTGMEAKARAKAAKARAKVAKVAKVAKGTTPGTTATTNSTRKGASGLTTKATDSNPSA